ncbi:MAG TPA: NADH-quinone oxidoreductase subunit M [Solirubrobacterales bacterium]|jgi:NADH-quinone oxidoreductase subunit M|nr:NADH-quinone oxidoreductase subunit M [Solirubrobacterales bacterium]
MLVAIFVVPVAVGLIGFLLPARVAGWWATLGALASLVLAIVLAAGFDPAGGNLQDVVDQSWIPQLGVRFQLGVDGISIFLVLLTALLWAAATLWSALQVPDRPRNYFFMLGLCETATLGCFLAQDLLLFVLCFDLMLVPLYFLIGAWGTGERVRATIKMIVYTLVGSLLMLVGAIATAVLSADAAGGVTFSIEALRQAPLADGTQYWIFCFFAAAFLVKMPAILVHGWVVDAYRSCPLPVLILLGGVLSKVAAYGFLRIAIPVFPDASVHFQELLLIIGLASILYGSAMAFTRTHLRDIVAFSSIAQMGFITIGIFSLSGAGGDGSVIQMVNHALVVAPIFLIIALLAERTGTEDIREMGGMAKRAPVFAILFVVVTMALLAMPGSANFVGEFFILKGLFETKVAIALIASSGIAFAAFYALRMYQRTMHDPLPAGSASREMTLREGVVLVPLVACIVALALYPGLITTRGEAAVDRSLAAVTPDATPPPEAIAER